MLGGPTPKSPDTEVFRYMHDTAGKYHLHYSNVRSIITSINFSVGLLSSVILLIHHSQTGRIFPIFFIIFIYITTLGLNIVFSRWSRVCRQIERYYEVKMSTTDSYIFKDHGFRHIFRQLILAKEYPKTPPENFPAKLVWSWEASIDSFAIAILVFGLVYIITYTVFICLF